MRLLFVADGRSPTALNWIGYFLDQGHEVHLATTFPCVSDERLASLTFISVAFSSAKVEKSQPHKHTRNQNIWGSTLLQTRTFLRHWFGPVTIPLAAKRLRSLIDCVQPEIVHAMRIPYEGMLVAQTRTRKPWLVSVWGNDFTLHAPSSPMMAYYTRLVMQQASALHTDCQRDQQLALTWGFSTQKPMIVLPGAGGIKLDQFYPPSGDELPNRRRTVVNPRGFRAYVRNDIFFQSIPLVLARLPGIRFYCPAMAGEVQAQRWLADLGVAQHVELLPRLTRDEMADLFRRSRVVVSPTTHDGTPNTLLEAMACGCFPVAGDIASLREWITNGNNGLLTDPCDPQALANAILTGLEDDAFYQRAVGQNMQLVAERAEYWGVMAKAADFYNKIAQI